MEDNDYMSTQEVLTGIKTWVKKEIGTNIYDISANHNGAKYADLSAALGTNGANIPQSLRKGGMSVKFVQNSDNKYVQYMCKTSTWSSTPTDWEKITESYSINVNVLNNVPETAFESAMAARLAVPVNLKKVGLILTYLLSDGWHTEQFKGDSSFSNWSQDYNWIPLAPIKVNQGRLVIGGTDTDITSSYCLNVNNIAGTPNTPFESAMAARIAVPSEYRKYGLIITYLLSDGWHTQQFNKTTNYANWSQDIYWDDIYAQGDANKSDLLQKQVSQIEFGLVEQQPIDGQISNANVFDINGGTHKIIRVTGGMKFDVIPKEQYKAQIFFLKSYRKPTSEDYVPDFCNGYNTRQTLDYGTYTTPSDCKYIAVGYTAGATNIYPKIAINGVSIDNSLYEHLSQSVHINEFIYGKNTFNAWLNNSNVFSGVGNPNNLSGFIPVYGGETLSIKKGGYNVVLFLCKSFEIPSYDNQVPVLCDGETGRRSYNEDTAFVLPSDCRFVLLGLVNNGVHVEPKGILINGANVINGVLSAIKDSQNLNNYSDAYLRNIGKTKSLLNACRSRIESSTSKDTQLILLGDQHNDALSIANAVEIMNGFDTIDGMINLGDCASAFNDGFSSDYFSILEKAKKPIYHTLGNHDVGYSPLVAVAGSNQQCFDKWIAPLISKGWLSNGEYESGKCYYYHDFTGNKTRLISLYAYDDDNEFYTYYWKPITYNSSYSEMSVGASYVSGDKININGYTEYSFECQRNVIIDNSTTHPTQPSYKFDRGRNVIRQTQAQWFLDTLASTPQDYSVVIAIHGVPTENFAIDKAKGGVFCQDLNKTAANFGGYGMYDFIADAVNAFEQGVLFNQTVLFRTYQGFDGQQAYYAQSYSVGKDFSVYKNSGVKFQCWLCGHTHYDLVWKHDTYQQYCINAITSNTSYGSNHVFYEGGVSSTDISRTDIDGLAKDSLSVISFNHSRGMNKVALVKVGVDTTIDAVKRDFAVLHLDD